MGKFKVLFIVFFSIFFAEFAYANSENVSYEEAKNIADAKITEICNGEECENVITLYNLKDEVTGYCFQYNEGYVIVGTDKNNVPIIEYGEDNCFLLKAMREINKKICEIKVLYLGGISYAIISDDNKCFYINSDGINECLITDLQEEVDSGVDNNIEEQWKMAKKLATQGSTYKGGEITNTNDYEKYYYSSTRKTVQNYNITYELMSNFSGYKDHCAPTAAVNLMKYWYIRDNKKYNILYKNSWDNSFKVLYNYMGTAAGIGTYTSELVNAYTRYFNSCSGLSGTTVRLINNCTFSNIITEINAGYPFHLCVYGNNFYKNHSLLGIGYVSYTYFENSVYTHVNYIMVADGWSSSPRYVNSSIGTGSMDIVTVRVP